MVRRVTYRNEGQWDEQSSEDSEDDGTPTGGKIHLLLDLFSHRDSRLRQLMNPGLQEVDVLLLACKNAEKLSLNVWGHTAEV